MGQIKRGRYWWIEFQLNGVRVRESTKAKNKAEAIALESKRREEIRLGVYDLHRVKPLKLSEGAKAYLRDKAPGWSPSSRRIAKYSVARLIQFFGNRYVTEIGKRDLPAYQTTRQSEGAAASLINMEVNTLGSILRHHDLHNVWARIRVRPLKVSDSIGRALSEDETHRLLVACKASRSRSLYPAVLLSLHTGLRNAELRNLRWRQLDLIDGILTVGRSKTVGGEGRLIPLSRTALACMKDWRSQFPDAKPAHYIFPTERIGVDGFSEHNGPIARETNPEKPMGKWQSAWESAKESSGVNCRWHDLRHTFISRLAEGQASDATIMSLAGHLSRKMMEKYSHVRNEAKRDAIAALDSHNFTTFSGRMEV